MLYFSQSLVEPDKLDLSQFTTLTTFKEKMRLEGLMESYNGLSDFRQKFSRQLGVNIGNLISAVLEEKESKKSRTAKGQSGNKAVIKPTMISPIEAKTETLSSDKVDEYLINAVRSVASSDGWSRIAAVGAYLQRYTPVDYHAFNFPKLQGFLKSRKLFEFSSNKGHPILRMIPR